jgi:hypothetical protein
MTSLLLVAVSVNLTLATGAILTTATGAEQLIAGNVPGRDLSLGDSFNIHDLEEGCLRLFPDDVATTPPALVGDKEGFSCGVYDSIASVMESESVDIRFAARYMAVKGSATLDSFRKHSSYSRVLTAYARGTANLGVIRLAATAVPLETINGEAVGSLTKARVQYLFGTHVVSAVRLGGWLDCRFSLELRMDEREEDQKATFGLAVNALAGNASLDVERHKSAFQMLSSGRIQYQILVQGGDKLKAYEFHWKSSANESEAAGASMLLSLKDESDSKTVTASTPAEVTAFADCLNALFRRWRETVTPTLCSRTPAEFTPIGKYLPNAAGLPLLGGLRNEIRKALAQHRYLAELEDRQHLIVANFAGTGGWIFPDQRDAVLQQHKELASKWTRVSLVFIESLCAAEAGDSADVIVTAFLDKYRDGDRGPFADAIASYDVYSKVLDAVPAVSIENFALAVDSTSALFISFEIHGARPDRVRLYYGSDEAKHKVTYNMRVDPGQDKWEDKPVRDRQKDPGAWVFELVKDGKDGDSRVFWRGAARTVR